MHFDFIKDYEAPEVQPIGDQYKGYPKDLNSQWDSDQYRGYDNNNGNRYKQKEEVNLESLDLPDNHPLQQTLDHSQPYPSIYKSRAEVMRDENERLRNLNMANREDLMNRQETISNDNIDDRFAEPPSGIVGKGWYHKNKKPSPSFFNKWGQRWELYAVAGSILLLIILACVGICFANRKTLKPKLKKIVVRTTTTTSRANRKEIPGMFD